MRAVAIVLHDLGGALHLGKVQELLGHTPRRFPMVAGSEPSFGPFEPPVSVQFTHDDCDIEVVLHSVGVAAIRMARPVADWTAVPRFPDPEQWTAAIKEDVAPALYEPYPAAKAIERWDIRLVPGPVSDTEAATRFILGPGRHSNGPDVVERADGGVMIGHDAAVIWGPNEDILDVLELARAELLEFRAYDAYLDDRLEGAYHNLDRLWGRGGIVRSARATLRELSQVRVEVARLTDPLHGTGKAFGDRFTQRVHAVAQERLRIGAWEQAVVHKTGVLEDMFTLAQEETHHRRALVLEAMIVLLFILDLILLVKVG